MLTRKCIPFNLMIGVALILSACGSQPSAPAPTQTPASVPPTNPPAPQATVNCDPDIHAMNAADISGVWGGISIASAGKATLTFNQDGSMSVILVEPFASAGVPKGFVVGSGTYSFDGAQLKLESPSCEDAKGNLFSCIGVYEACVTKQGDQPTHLRLVAIDDPYTGRKRSFTSSLPLTIVQQ